MPIRKSQSLPAVVGGVIILIAILYGLYSWMVWGTLVSPIPATCTLGVRSTAANITFSGWGAQHVCDGTATSDSKDVYAQSSPPQGTELCEGDLHRKTATIRYIVRDTGFFNIVGSALCKAVDKIAEQN